MAGRRLQYNFVLDMGTYGLRLLQAESAVPGEIHLKRLIQTEAPKEFVVSTFIENPIMDPEMVQRRLRELAGGIKERNSEVMVLLPDHAAIINLMLAPPKFSTREVEAAVREDLAPIMPLPIDQWHLIHQTIGTWEEDEITVAMAIIKANLLEAGALIQEAGFSPQVMDLNFFNVANLIEFYLNSDDNKGRNLAVVHLGNETTSIGVFRDGQIRSFLNRPVGGYDFTKKISKHFHVPEAEADQFKRNEVFFLPEYTPEQDGLYNFTVIRETFSVMTREIFSALESYLARFRETSIHEIIISGGGANFQNIQATLAANMNSPVRPVAGLYHATENGQPLSDEARNTLAPACGAFFRG
jgi:type IV pilus assembly protein PilM